MGVTLVYGVGFYDNRQLSQGGECEHSGSLGPGMLPDKQECIGEVKFVRTQRQQGGGAAEGKRGGGGGTMPTPMQRGGGVGAEESPTGC